MVDAAAARGTAVSAAVPTAGPSVATAPTAPPALATMMTSPAKYSSRPAARRIRNIRGTGARLEEAVAHRKTPSSQQRPSFHSVVVIEVKE